MFCTALSEQILPNAATILSFDVRSYWTKLEERTFKKKCQSSLFTNDEREDQQVPSPPLSPVISSLGEFRPLKNGKTSTPLIRNVADRKATKSVSEHQTLVRKSLDKENCFDDDNEFFEGEHSAIEQATSQVKADASSSAAFLEAAALAVSFEENAASEKAKIGAKEICQFEVDLPEDFFNSADSFEQNFVRKKVDSSLFSATQLVNLLDKSSASKNVAKPPFSDVKPRLPNVLKSETSLCSKTDSFVSENAMLPNGSSVRKTGLSNGQDSSNSGYSLDDLPPLKFGNEDHNVCAGELDLFSDFDLGSPELKPGSPELKLGSPELKASLPEYRPDSPELRQLSEEFDCDLPTEPEANIQESKNVFGPEFKLPNLEDFELRSKTPKKIHHASKFVLDQSAASRSSFDQSETCKLSVNQSATSESILNHPSTSSNYLSTGKSPPPLPGTGKSDSNLVESTKLDESSLDSPIAIRRKPKSVALLLSSSEDENDESPEQKKRKTRFLELHFISTVSCLT